MRRSALAQASTLLGAALFSFLLGWLLAVLMRIPESPWQAFFTMPFFIVLTGGLVTWVFIARILAWSILGSIFFKRLAGKKEARDPDLLTRLQSRIRFATCVFPLLGLFIGGVWGAIGSSMDGVDGVLPFLSILLSCLGWGLGLGFLARRGWLPWAWDDA